MSWYENFLPDVEFIKERLQEIVPENVEDANFARNIVAARTIFVMLYSYAIEGERGKVRPSTITAMGDTQAAKLTRAEREKWLKVMQSPKKPDILDRWYKENTRESIRDDTISTFKMLGIVEELEGIAVTSSKPRYYLAADFAYLLNPSLIGDELYEAIDNWRIGHVHKGALILQSLKEQEKRSVVFVEFGHTKHALSSGRSSVLTKEAIEVFASNFLIKPEVLLISESADKVHWQFGKLLKKLGLAINPKRTLPDIIIAETGDPSGMKLIFIEIVHTDGPISGDRKRELLEFAQESGLGEESCEFVTVFTSRSDAAYRKVQGSIAWGSFVWFADEPERIVHLIDTENIGKRSLSSFKI